MAVDPLFVIAVRLSRFVRVRRAPADLVEPRVPDLDHCYSLSAGDVCQSDWLSKVKNARELIVLWWRTCCLTREDLKYSVITGKRKSRFPDGEQKAIMIEEGKRWAGKQGVIDRRPSLTGSPKENPFLG